MRRQPSANQGEKPETNPAGNFISSFQFPGLSENKFLLFKSPSLWYSVMTAELTDVPVVNTHPLNQRQPPVFFPRTLFFTLMCLFPPLVRNFKNNSCTLFAFIVIDFCAYHKLSKQQPTIKIKFVLTSTFLKYTNASDGKLVSHSCVMGFGSMCILLKFRLIKVLLRMWATVWKWQMFITLVHRVEGSEFGTRYWCE